MQWNDSEHLAVRRKALDERLSELWKEFEINLFKQPLWHEMPEREEYYTRNTEIKTVAYRFPAVFMYICVSKDFHITINIRLNPELKLSTNGSEAEKNFFKLSDGQVPDCQILKCLAVTERRFFLIHALAKLEPVKIILVPNYLVEFFFKSAKPFCFIKCTVAVEEQLTILSYESYVLKPAYNPPTMRATHFRRIDELVDFVKILLI